MDPTHNGSPTSHEDPPFLGAEPPPWAARGLTWLILGVFVTSLIGAIIVRVPETVAGRFVLVPLRGADPVRTARRGQVSEVRIAEGATIARGAPLFVLRSDPIGDRASELGGLRAQLAGSEQALRNARTEYESRVRADAQETASLEARLAALRRAITLKQRQRDLAEDAVRRYRSGVARGTVSADELTARELEAARLGEELEMAQGERSQTAAAVQRIRHQAAARDAEHRERLRSLEQSYTQARIRTATLERELTGSTGSELFIASPCAGTVLRLFVRGEGAVVQEGDLLAEIACADRRLLAELTVPPSGVARMREGQRVKLLYDAFPYQRYGTKSGLVRWVSPSGAIAEGETEATTFRALVDIQDTSVRVDGAPRPLLAGMGGSARVVVGKRTLVSYAFDPIRQLRESFADGEVRQ